MDANEKFIYMTTEPVPRLVTSLAVPTIISMLITSFYNMVDTFFVGRINTSATAAVEMCIRDRSTAGPLAPGFIRFPETIRETV